MGQDIRFKEATLGLQPDFPLEVQDSVLNSRAWRGLGIPGMDSELAEEPRENLAV